MALIKTIPIRGEKLSINIYTELTSQQKQNIIERYKTFNTVAVPITKNLNVLETKGLLDLVLNIRNNQAIYVYVNLIKTENKNSLNTVYTGEDAFFIIKLTEFLIKRKRIKVAEDLLHALNNINVLTEFYKGINHDCCGIKLILPKKDDEKYQDSTLPQTIFKKRFSGKNKYSVYRLINDLVEDQAEIQVTNYKRISNSDSNNGIGILKNEFGKIKSIIYNNVNTNLNISVIYKKDVTVIEDNNPKYKKGEKVQIKYSVTLNFINNGIKNDIRWVIVKVSKPLKEKLEKIKELVDFSIPIPDNNSRYYLVLDLVNLAAFSKKDIDIIHNMDYNSINSNIIKFLVFKQLNYKLNALKKLLPEKINSSYPTLESLTNTNTNNDNKKDVIKTGENPNNIKTASFYLRTTIKRCMKFNSSKTTGIDINKTIDYKILFEKLDYLIYKEQDNDIRESAYKELIKQKKKAEEKIKKLKIIFSASRGYRCNKKILNIYNYYYR